MGLPPALVPRTANLKDFPVVAEVQKAIVVTLPLLHSSGVFSLIFTTTCFHGILERLISF